MFGSRWNYVICGFCLLAAIIFALAHQGLWLGIECLFIFWNWNVAEDKRKLEEQILLAEYEKSKDNPE